MTLKLHTLARFFAAAAGGLAVLPALAVAPLQGPPQYREGQLLVKYRDGAHATAAQTVRAKLGLVPTRTVDDIELVQLPRVTTTAAALAVLRADPAVEYAEPNFLRHPRTFIPNDQLFNRQWGLLNTGQDDFSTGTPGTAGADMNLAEAWDSDGDGAADRTGDPAVIVAVIDDAIQISHPDLKASIVSPHNFIACQTASDPSPVSQDGFHGTLVSGCITGQGDNGAGIAGVAWTASLMPLKFDFDTVSHLDAIRWARDHGAKIINASFGGPGFSQAEQDLIASLQANDILYVAAGGNDDSNTDLGQINYPANYPAENIVAVAASNRLDDLTGFSQYGPMTVDVAAPGTQIISTRINNAYAAPPGVSGTSFSSPYTAGVAALVKSHVAGPPGWAEIKARLIESGTVSAGANAKQMTVGGRVDADAALDMAARPALVVRAITFDDSGGNNLPDSGESLTVSFTLKNLWQGATNVSAALTADNGVNVTAPGTVAVGAIASQDQAVATFPVTVDGAITGHRYVHFTLTLTADGGYSAVRAVGAELGTLAPDGNAVAQSFNGDPYDEFHAWHVDVPPTANPAIRTLVIRTHVSAGQDIDLLAKRDVPPQYDITVGINPEFQAGNFCTSGTVASCDDPLTLVSAALAGEEAVSVVDPQPGTYHLVVVNFDQLATPYTLTAQLIDGDVRPEPFTFNDVSGLPNNTLVESNEVLISGIDAGKTAFVTIVGGQYQIESNPFTNIEGTISSGQRIKVRANTGFGGGRAQLNIGGVTETFAVNAPATEFVGGGGDTSCPGNGGGSIGAPTPALLALLLAAALARRRLRRR